jgi:hypothetical protein
MSDINNYFKTNSNNNNIDNLLANANEILSKIAFFDSETKSATPTNTKPIINDNQSNIDNLNRSIQNEYQLQSELKNHYQSKLISVNFDHISFSYKYLSTDDALNLS